MKKILTGAVLVGTAMSAQAADLPARTYTKAPAMAAVYDWTGFYIGANAGVGLGRDRTFLEVPATYFDTTHLSPQGGFGGGQIGYNVQTGSFLGPILLGVEADIQGGGFRDDRTSLLGFGLFNAQFNQRLDWFGTVRGRLGVVNGPVVSYVTAGYAYGDVKTTVNESVGGVPTGSFTTSGMRTGWTYGSGVEASLGGNWTGKVEYLYVNLGNRNDLFTLGGTPQALNTQIRENIFRAGLNYRIGGNGMYAAMPAANWSGLYVGGNFGGGTARDRTSLVAPGANELFNLSPDGYFGGGQIGYNWQAANWVFGVETDIQGSWQRDNKACIATCSVGTFAAYDARLPWFGTARGRIGYSVGSTLFYATGGYAYGQVKTDINSPFGFYSLRHNTGGWTAGGGIESPITLFGLLGANWTSKTEYLYVDLGTSSDSGIVTGVGLATNTGRVQEHIFRTGINYHFNSPVVARY